uniref:HIT-type domain-containing protein n=1 Tax=Physcomitrium patens TaxID=3218 RepID=A0A7I4BAU3_PHYPA
MSDLSESKSVGINVSEQRLICRVCTRNFSQYTCPRCNIRYCSLQCYKKHSVRCTEQFARENVLEEMKGLNVTPESKQRMLEALQRIHFDDEGRSVFEDDYMQVLNGEGEEPSEIGFDTEELLSEDTLQSLQEGVSISFEDLSASEKKAFMRAVAAGKFSHLIKPWDPWWTHPLAHNISLTKSGMQLVQPLEEQTPKEVTSLDEEALSDSGDPLDAALVLLCIAKVLGVGSTPESVSAALAGCLESVCSPSFKHAGGYRFGSSLFDDTALLLRLKREGILCALADAYRLIDCAVKDLKTHVKNKEGSSTAILKEGSSSAPPKSRVKHEKKGYSKRRSSNSRRLRTAQKKLYFMICWVNEQI